MEERLIHKVREHEALYDIHSAKYRDYNVRNEAWEEIGAELNLPAGRCKELWAMLRNCFANAVKRRRSKKWGQGINKNYTPWKYESQMAFLLPFMKERSGRGILSNSIIYGEEMTNGMNKQFDASEDDETHSGLPVGIPKIESPTPKRRKLDHPRDLTEFFKQSPEDIKDRYSESYLTTQPYDEVDMFYLSMARTIKQLPKIEQARLRMQFCTMVSEVEIKYVASDSLAGTTVTHHLPMESDVFST
ncbi:uncharacterized protein [Prorops nasuta]|uniref:uncharacterized protein n=1 Tax=Prorops nasuta TaxID=863751 RepID=UPI0034CE8561